MRRKIILQSWEALKRERKISSVMRARRTFDEKFKRQAAGGVWMLIELLRNLVLKPKEILILGSKRQ